MDVAGVIFDDGGRVLVLRKRGAHRFTLPGGKIESGESPLETAMREIREELGIGLSPEDLRPLGTVEGLAANETDTPIRSTVFVCEGYVPETAHAEIEEMRWIDSELQPGDPEADSMSPLLVNEILPRFRARS